MQSLSHGIYLEFYKVTFIVTQKFQNVSNEMACANRVVVWEVVTAYMRFLFRVESNIFGCSGGEECNLFIFPYFWNVLYYFVPSSLYVLFCINNSHETD